MFLKVNCRENRHSDRHIHCTVHSTDSVIWSLNIHPRSPSCLVSQQPSNASAVLCLDSALHVLACHLERFFMLLHERQSGTVGMSVTFRVCSQVTMGRLTNLLREERRNGQSDRSSVVEVVSSGGITSNLRTPKYFLPNPDTWTV